MSVLRRLVAAFRLVFALKYLRKRLCKHSSRSRRRKRLCVTIGHDGDALARRACFTNHHN
jgi:hypothetical protein